MLDQIKQQNLEMNGRHLEIQEAYRIQLDKHKLNTEFLVQKLDFNPEINELKA
jgi:hypothetical protein